MGLFSKLFGTYSERQIKQILPLVDKIEALAGKYSAMSDEELKECTNILKNRLANGESLDDILVDAFALVREADERILGKRPFRVQLIGGIILHQGRIAEMKTGEGKTLVATLPAYLNALSGKGVHIITVNEYLARLGAEEMGRVYEFLGLTTGLIASGQSHEEKQAAYKADITYGTNNEFGFDYLRDNMVVYKENLMQRGHVFAIVDEVDSILIDEARTPLIISGHGEESTEMYEKANTLVKSMREFRIKEFDSKKDTDEIEEDYIVDEKARSTMLTAHGIEKAEAFFKIDNFSDPDNSELAHYVNQAVRARGIMKRDVDYVIKDNQVIIVDAFTGRLMFGRRYSNGLHQAIEAKENVKIQNEDKTLASITFQNYFRLYSKLSGMTGTALTEDVEFREIYNLDVVAVPTNKEMIRIDHTDVIYSTTEAKYNAIIEQIKKCNQKEQPVLVGTVSVDKSEELSKRLKREGITHTVLNAKYHEKEAEIVADAGKPSKVTIATNMAGRGTDIMLGGNPEFLAKQDMIKKGYDEDVVGLAVGTSLSVSEEVLEARKVFKELFEKYKKEVAPLAEKVRNAGGLFIIGTERHESRRIDNQLRGRSGRQGDPGESRFYISLEDDIARLFGGDKLYSIVDKLGIKEGVDKLEIKFIADSIETAQKRVEDQNFTRRKNVLSYDDVLNQQREIIYKQRSEVLDGLDLKEKIRKMISTMIHDQVLSCTLSSDKSEWNFDEIRNFFYGYLCSGEDFKYSPEELNDLTAESIIEELEKRADNVLETKETAFGSEKMREIERTILLHAVDVKWMDHIDMMDDLKGSVGLQSYAQRDPLKEYQIIGAELFDEMITGICQDTARGVLSIVPQKDKKIVRKAAAKVVRAGFNGDGEVVKKEPIRNTNKVGRNEKCPCGSGLKYKKCCGRNENTDTQNNAQ